MDRKAGLGAFLSEHVTPYLLDRGFHRSGYRYQARRGQNLFVIRFQRRGRFFTADLVVVSALLIEAFGSMPPEHWTVRLGEPTVGYDKWWDLEEGSRAVSEDFLPTLGDGIDHMEPFVSDEGLRDALLRELLADPRGLPPMLEEWCIALIRKVGAGDWART